jgi:hypothetical protein
VATLAALLMFHLDAPVLAVNNLPPARDIQVNQVSCRMLFSGALATV